MKALKLNIFYAAVVLSGLSGTAYSQSSLTKNATDQGLCKYIGFLAGCPGTKNQNLADGTSAGYFSLLVDAFIFIGAIVAVIFLLVGGIKYITSGGDPGRIASAKNTIQYAIIGLIIVIIARVIIGFVIGRV